MRVRGSQKDDLDRDIVVATREKSLITKTLRGKLRIGETTGNLTNNIVRKDFKETVASNDKESIFSVEFCDRDKGISRDERISKTVAKGSCNLKSALNSSVLNKASELFDSFLLSRRIDLMIDGQTFDDDLFFASSDGRRRKTTDKTT